MKRKIALLGAGPLGLNVAGIVQKLPQFEIVGFIDSKPGPVAGIDVLGDDAVLDRLWDEGVRDLVVCLGNSERRVSRGRELKEQGFQLPAVVHPTADLGVGVHLGDGCIIFPCAVVLPESRVGDFGIVEAGVFVGHHSKLGAGALLGARSLVGNRSELEELVTVGMGASVPSGASVPAGSRIADFGMWE